MEAVGAGESVRNPVILWACVIEVDADKVVLELCDGEPEFVAQMEGNGELLVTELCEK